MARAEVPVIALDMNVGKAFAGEAIDTTDNHFIDLSGYGDDQITIVISNVTANTGTYIVKAGDFSSASQGDLEGVIPASTGVVLQLESARFKNSDGQVLLDLASDTTAVTGHVYAIGSVY